jgi:ADP-ribose pyrophosphatase YjhB (NUDIX family)
VTPTRVLVTALLVSDGRLLLAQLAAGPWAGYWLLPSATVETGTIEDAARTMTRERTGYALRDPRLLTVIEEARAGVRILRFAFAGGVGDRDPEHRDPELARTGWFSREAVAQVLQERDVQPTLGVMSLLRAWADGVTPEPLETLVDDALCPCGSGFRYPGCCGWDAK